MKKLAIGIIGMIIIFAACILFCITSYAQTKDPIEGYYTICSVNMRKGPGLRYDVYKVLPQAYLLNTINDMDPSGWLEIWEDDNVYFVYIDYTEMRLPKDGDIDTVNRE